MGWKDNMAKQNEGKIIPGIGSKRRWVKVGGNEEPSTEEAPVFDFTSTRLNISPDTPILKVPEDDTVTCEDDMLNVIIAERNTLDITQQEMADHLGMRILNYRNIEAGKTTLLPKYMFKIFEKLNLKITIR
jgi:DNA-binding XRE family transcriptional regulator